MEAPNSFAEFARALAEIATDLHLRIRRREIEETGFSARREREKSVLSRIVKEGWFIHPFLLPFLPQFNRFHETDWNEIQSIMKRFFRGRVNDIGNQLKEAYPKRSQIFEEAFEAHREAKYCLSIPVLLAQCDGLMHHQFGQSWFTLQGRQAVVDKLNAMTPDAQRLFTDPETWEETPVWLSKKKRPRFYDELNRHQVLHGESTNYNTETNSLRVISMINYVHCIINEYKTFVSNEMGFPFRVPD